MKYLKSEIKQQTLTHVSAKALIEGHEIRTALKNIQIVFFLSNMTVVKAMALAQRSYKTPNIHTHTPFFTGFSISLT